MNFQICPPAPESHHTAHFDRFQFQRPRHRKALRVDFRELGTRTCAVERRERRLETPDWVWDDKRFREAILRYLENRFFISKTEGTYAERLKRVRETAQRHAFPKTKILERRAAIARAILQERYADLSEGEYTKLFLAQLRGKTPRDRVKDVAREAQSLHAEVHVMEKSPEIVAAIAYCYYRLEWDSPTIGEEFGINPAAIRQILFRMNRAARRLKK